MTYLFSRDGVDGGSAVALVCLQPSLLLSFASVPVCFSLPAAPVSVLFLCVFLSFFIVFHPLVLWFFSSLSPCFLVFFSLGSACVMLHWFFFISPPCRSWLFLLPLVLPFFLWFFVPFSVQKSPSPARSPLLSLYRASGSLGGGNGWPPKCSVTEAFNEENVRVGCQLTKRLCL